MKIKCKNCGREIDADSLFCTYCGERNSPGTAELAVPYPYNRRKRKNGLIAIACTFGAIAAIVLLILFLNANLLLPGQSMARADKKAMLAYIDMNYPGAKIVDKNYATTRWWEHFLAFAPNDRLQVEWNGVKFWIAANNGNVILDNYAEYQTFSDLSELIYYDFFIEFFGYHKPKMDPRDEFPEFIFKTEDGKSLTDFYNYDGELFMEITVNEDFMYLEEVEWLWDFYYYMIYSFPDRTGIDDYLVRMNINLHDSKYKEYFADARYHKFGKAEFYGDFISDSSDVFDHDDDLILIARYFANLK